MARLDPNCPNDPARPISAGHKRTRSPSLEVTRRTVLCSTESTGETCRGLRRTARCRVSAGAVWGPEGFRNGQSVLASFWTSPVDWCFWDTATVHRRHGGCKRGKGPKVTVTGSNIPWQVSKNPRLVNIVHSIISLSLISSLICIVFYLYLLFVCLFFSFFVFLSVVLSYKSMMATFYSHILARRLASQYIKGYATHIPLKGKATCSATICYMQALNIAYNYWRIEVMNVGHEYLRWALWSSHVWTPPSLRGSLPSTPPFSDATAAGCCHPVGTPAVSLRMRGSQDVCVRPGCVCVWVGGVITSTVPCILVLWHCVSPSIDTGIELKLNYSILKYWYTFRIIWKGYIPLSRGECVRHTTGQTLISDARRNCRSRGSTQQLVKGMAPTSEGWEEHGAANQTNHPQTQRYPQTKPQNPTRDPQTKPKGMRDGDGGRSYSPQHRFMSFNVVGGWVYPRRSV